MAASRRASLGDDSTQTSHHIIDTLASITLAATVRRLGCRHGAGGSLLARNRHKVFDPTGEVPAFDSPDLRTRLE